MPAKAPIITEDLVIRLVNLIDQGLPIGLGQPIPGQMCIEACVCFVLGLPHSDKPLDCVARVLNSLKISLNDKPGWGTNAARAAGMRRLGVAQLGSAGALDETEFAKRLAKMTIQKVVPLALRSIANQTPAIKAAIQRCEQEGTASAAANAANAAGAAGAAGAAAARAAAANAANAAGAAGAAAAGARAAAGAADYASAAADYASAAPKNRTLAWFAEEVVQILVSMNAPGCQWLYLVPLAKD